ncbi:MAG: hypothetical protein J1F33_04635 [Clostridiales bacterium]|nr:hypothetical protein [Clostridiales bacterium]
MVNTSIRFFEDVQVRAVWDDKSSKWRFCAVDVVEALVKINNPRSYWNALKRRKSRLSTTENKSKRRQAVRRPTEQTTELFMKGIDYSYCYEAEK